MPIKEERKNGTILDVLINPVIFDNKDDKVTEFVRIAYVAFSRVKNNLYIHLKNTRLDIQPLVDNLNKYCIENDIKEPFYEIIDLN